MSTDSDLEQESKPIIMVVDDNPEFLSGIELTLEMEGFKVWTANNGQHAMDQLEKMFLMRQHTGGTGLEALPDLIVADIMMPEMDGYEFYDKVRANPFTNHIPFIFLTAKSSDENIRHGKELGADDYFSKLDPPENLLSSIRGKLNRAKQRRQINDEYVGDPTKSLMSGSFIAIAVIGSLVTLAFCLGIAFASGFLGQ